MPSSSESRLFGKHSGSSPVKPKSMKSFESRLVSMDMRRHKSENWSSSASALTQRLPEGDHSKSFTDDHFTGFHISVVYLCIG